MLNIRGIRKLLFCLSLLYLNCQDVTFGDDTPVVYDSEQSSEKPLSGLQATQIIKLPEGFEAKLFASEPMVRNPIAMQYDSSGRLWIAENFSYAERGLRLDPNLRDRIVIFSDSDQDGTADQTSIFTDQLHNLTGFAMGRGGIWAICPPQLLFIPDFNSDDRPDGPPEVMLDGFQVPLENHHNFANGLKFGPDGWLYGRAGGSSPSEVGLPGTPDSQRIPLRGGIWRYHPTLKRFEVLTHGTTNPWGMDWDRFGEMFFVNTVNGHLWHLIAGAHLHRLHTIDPNPYVYQMIDTIADHYHFDTGQGWAASRDGVANELGGGHAHQGALIYQGGTWPEKYWGRLFTINFHGRRINSERLVLGKGGYRGIHDPDLAIFGDTWFRGIDMAHSPDGNIAVIDWSDTGECHENTGVHRSSGRIYLIKYKAGNPHAAKSNQKTDLLADLKSAHIFQVRCALETIANNPKSYLGLTSDLKSLMNGKNPTEIRLRSIWALHALGNLSEKELLELTRDSDAHVRTWAIRLLVDRYEIDTVLGDRRGKNSNPMPEWLNQKLTETAKSETDYLVRLALGSALQRMPVGMMRLDLARNLATQTSVESGGDLPLLIWYGISPLVETMPEKLVSIIEPHTYPLLNQMIARSLASLGIGDQPNVHLNQLVLGAASMPVSQREAMLKGILEGLAGRDRAARPDGWDRFASGLNKESVDQLSALFGDGIPVEAIKMIVADPKAEMPTRINALRTLIRRKPADLEAFCLGLLGTRFLNTEALAGLRSSADPKVAISLVRSYRSFSLQDRPLVLDFLTQRPEWAKILLEAVAENRLPKEEISVIQARQILALGQKEISDLLRKTWGEIRPQREEATAFLNQVRKELKTSDGQNVDYEHARTVYMRTCGQCHTLYGEGGRIGPDITGAQRQNLDYLLENIVDPSSVVSPDFRLTHVAFKDGRIVSGLVRPRDRQAITLITASQTMIIPRDQIEEEKPSTQSIMPEGQLEAMTPNDRVALLKYLMTERPPELK